MPRRTAPPAAQLGLDLRRTAAAPAIAEGSQLLLQTLADLLLGALGVEVEAGNEANQAGENNASEDHV